MNTKRTLDDSRGDKYLSQSIALFVAFSCLLAVVAGPAPAGVRAAPTIETGLWDNYGPSTPDFPGSSIIRAIASDGLERPWIGTNGGGVAHFDGATWQRYTTADGLASNNVRDIFPQGAAVWVATNNGVSYFDGVDWSTVGGVPSTNVRAITFRSGVFSTYLIATFSGLAECNLFYPPSFACSLFSTSNSDLPHNWVYDVAVSAGDVRWAVTKGGVARITGSNTWTVFNNANTPDCPVITYATSIAVDDDNGRIWFGTDRTGGIDPVPGEGACMLETASGEWHHFHADSSGLNNDTVKDVAIDPEGRAWFATHPVDAGDPGGAYVCTWIDDECYWAGYTTDDSELPQDSLSAVGAGRERIWFGGWFGVWDPYPTIDSYAASLALYWQELGGGEIYALDYLPDEIWAATGDGIRRFDGANWTTTLGGVEGRALLALDTDDVWAGTSAEGAWHWDGGWRQFNTANSDLAGDNVRAIAQDNLGRLWFGTWADGASVYDPAADAWTTFDTATVLPSDRVHAAAVDAAGQVWLGTNDGLVRYDGISWRTFTTADGLPHDTIYALAVDDGGLIWAGTEGGAASWDGVDWTAVTDPLPDPRVRAVHAGADGLLWLGTDGGAISYDGDEWITYRARNSGLLNERPRAITSDEEGGLYFGGVGYSTGGVDVPGNLFFRRPLGVPLGNLTPIITSFDPQEALGYEWVTVSGERFTPGDVVQFKAKGFNAWHNASTIWEDDNTLDARVPPEAIQGPIRVMGDGGVATSGDTFDPLPRINSFDPENGFPGTPVTIYGYNLDSPNFDEIRFGASDWNSLIVVEQDHNRVRVVVPQDATTGPIRVRTDSGTAVSDDDFTVAAGGLQLFDWEIHQGLPGYPLVAGKSTVVRLFLGSSVKGVCAYATRAAIQVLDPYGTLNVYAGTIDNGGVPNGGCFKNDVMETGSNGSINVVIPGEYLPAGTHYLGLIITNSWVDLITEDLGTVHFTETGVARLHGAVPDWGNATTDELTLLDRQLANAARALPVRDGVGALGSGNGVEYHVQEYAVCDGTPSAYCGGDGDYDYEWDFWQQNSAGQLRACYARNNLPGASDDGDVLTFDVGNLDPGQAMERWFLARLRPGQTWPADLEELAPLTTTPANLTINALTVSTTFSRDEIVNCGAGNGGDIIAFYVRVTNGTASTTDVELEFDYDESVIITYGPGAVLLPDGDDFMTEHVPGVFFAAQGWGGNQFASPVDENYDGMFDERDFVYFVAEYEDWDPVAGEFTVSTDLDEIDSGDLIRQYRDLDGDYQPDWFEPRAPFWERADNKDAVFYEIPADYMVDYNHSEDNLADAEYSGLLFFERINPFLGPGQGHDGEFWADIDTKTTFGHEWGHALGQVRSSSINSNGGGHSENSRIDYVTAGYDFLDNQVVVGSQLLSIMWPSVRNPAERGFFEPAEYLDLFYQFWSKAGEQAGASSHPAQDETVFYITGILYDDDQITIGRSLLSDRLTPTASDPGSDYVIRFRGGGATLAEYGIPLNFEEHGPYDHNVITPVSSAPFSVIQPFPASTQAVEIWHNGNRLLRREVSETPPSVQVLAPQNGDVFGGSDEMTISWSGSDADGDDLTFAVRYSADGGASWQTLVPRTSGTSLAVSLEMLPGGNDAVVEVEASDGFHTAADRSDGSFSVGRKPPLAATINTPSDGQEFLQGQPITLVGGGYDLEDGPLSGSALSWSSDRDGALGSGSVLSATLTVGVHLITLEATDGDGGTVDGSVSVEVVPDFDGDGLSDAYEQTYGILDWWNGEDAGEDDDGDDLINAAEAEWGTDPTDPDTDGDGVTDGAEVSGGSVPTDGSSVPQPAFLIPSHTFLTFVATDAGSGDLEQLLLLMSSAPRGLDWTAASNAPWLTVEPASGTTPAVLTIRVDTTMLRPGLQTALLTFSGSAEDVIVPVYVTTPGQQIYLPLIAAP